MDFELAEEHLMIRDLVRLFVEKEVKPVASSMDAEGIFPRELVKRLGEIGLMGTFVPSEYGGAGMDRLSYVIAVEELARVWASLCVIMTVNNSLVCDPIARFGSDLQKKRYLAKLARAELLGCYGLTEPLAGADVAAIHTRAKRVKDVYILNGNKIFITNGREKPDSPLFLP